VDVLSSQGRPVAEAIRTIGVTAFIYYGGRKGFSGLKSDQVKRLKPFLLTLSRLAGARAQWEMRCVVIPRVEHACSGGFASLTLRVTR
jgi:hypothetical protein